MLATGITVLAMRRAMTCVSILLAACGGPVGPFAGGRLSGDVERDPIADWSFANQYALMQVETRPENPYSVNVHFYVVEGRLYIEAGRDRSFSRWRRLLWENPDVRVRFGERVYEVTAVEVTDPEEIAAVLPAFYEKDSEAPPAGCLPYRVDEQCPAPGVFARLEPRCPLGGRSCRPR